jgi:general secretion pathway protein D
MRTIPALLLLALVVCPMAAAAEPPENGKVMVNLAGVTLDSLVTQISQMTGKSAVLPPGFPGDKQVNIITAPGAGVQKEDLINLLGEALRTSGYTIVETPVSIRIVPFGEVSGVAVQDGTTMPMIGEALVTRIITLRNANASDMVGLLDSLKSKGAKIQPYPESNKLVITEVSSQMGVIEDIIKQLDKPMEGAMSKLHSLQYSSTQSLQPAVNSYVANLVKSADPIRKKQLAMLSVMPHQGTNAFVLFGTSSDIADVERFIGLLDVPPTGETKTVHTYPVLHRDAAEMGEVLSGVFAATKDTQGGVPGAIPTVIADATNNYLLIVTPLDKYTAEVLPILQRLDIKKQQVLIESALVEISMDKLADWGVELSTTDPPGSNPRGFGGTTFGLSTITAEGRVPIVPTAGGVTAGIFKDGLFNIPALIRLSARTDDVKFIASPLLMALDNEEATWEIAEEREYAKSVITAEGFTEVTGGQFNKAAVQLAITPHINAQGTVRLKIDQLTEQFLPSTALEDGTSLVNKTTRTANTTVVVPNGKTAVIAGLTRTVDSEIIRKVPILGDIPLLGFFFRRTEKVQEQRNLCVFITPYVLSDDEALSAEAKLRKDQLLERFKEEDEATLRTVEKVTGNRSGETPAIK